MISNVELAISTTDLIILLIYLGGTVALGCWVGIRRGKGNKSRSYFLAGSTLTWPVIGLALFSTNISTTHLVSLAQEGYVNGLAFANFEWMAAFTLIALSLFFAPFYIRSKITTLPDFLERRFSRPCRDWLAIVSIFSAIFIHIGFTLYAGALVMEGLFGFHIFWCILATALITGLYTIVGGLLAVVVTESIQTIVLLIGAICITLIAYFKAGGWEGLTATVDPVKLTVMRTSAELPSLPWYSVLLGYPIIGIWYWCADQTIVQRVLGAKDENHARLGPLFAGFIKILPLFIFVLPGLLCLALIKQGKLPDELTDSAQTYSFMISHLLPIGLKGVVAASLLAALMSTVAGALNSVATIFSYDIYKRWRPETSDRKLVLIGRLVTFFAMVAAIIWSPHLARFDSLFQGINALISYVAPPITAVFLFGIFWRRASSTGALTTLITGSLLGFTIFLLDWHKDLTGWNLPFLMAAFYLFCACSLILIVISLWKPDPPSAKVDALVWSNPLAALKGQPWRGFADYRFLAFTLALVMIVLYIVFD